MARMVVARCGWELALFAFLDVARVSFRKSMRASIPFSILSRSVRIRSSEAARRVPCLLSKIGHDVIICSRPGMNGFPTTLGHDGFSRGTKAK